MSKHWLQFRDIRVLSFAGIFKGKKAEVVYPEGFKPQYELDPNNGIVIFFPPEARYVEASGDQGTGKTSFLSLIRDSMGAKFFPHLINQQDKDRKYDETFERDGKLYRVKATRTQFDIYELIQDPETKELKREANGEPMGVRQKEPKELLQKIIGPVGISPMEVVAMKPDKQVEWIRKVVNLSDDQLQLEAELAEKIKKTYADRTKANNETNRLQQELDRSDYYKNYEQWEEYLAKNSFDNIDQELKDVNSRYQEYRHREGRMYDLDRHKSECEGNISRLEEQIRQLQLKIEQERKTWQACEKEVDEISLYLEENRSVVIEYENISNRVKESQEYNRHSIMFSEVKRNLSLYNQCSDEAIRLNNKLAELREVKKKFHADITPRVEGLEIFVPDEEEKREGIYYNGRPLNMVCESDNWKWFTAVAKEAGIKVICVENVSSLGTDSINQFNEFIQDGGFVFGTRMDRQTKDLRISFYNKMPV